ncbi:MAG: hypothetical protein M1831_000237 [Alyxoria varia]|nr:MAG: hypothetical protein M1831_000237 [Alyxoria varia]
MSGWSSRITNLMSGRFSPFSGSSGGPKHTVTDSDFAYIDPNDLSDDNHVRHGSSAADGGSREHGDIKDSRHHDGRHREHAHSSHSHRDATAASKANRPHRETDVLHLRHKRNIYTVHFPAYSIDDGALSIGSVREAAARKLEMSVHDARRIKMFWKGRNLNNDARYLREEGIRSNDEADVLCSIGASGGLSKDGDSASDSDGVGNSAEDGGDVALGEGKNARRNKKKRERQKLKKAESRDSDIPTLSSSSTYDRPTASSGHVEHLPIPGTHTHPSQRDRSVSPSARHQPSPRRQPSPQPPAPSPKKEPETPMAKLAAIRTNFEDTLVPSALAFIERPPAEKEKRDYEYKRLTETILTQVLIKLDGVETEGDEAARGRRKELVREMQGWLRRLDGVVGKTGGE